MKKREHYIPMIPEEKNKILRAMGIHASFEDISIKDFGESGDYKPIHEFFRYAYERKGDYLEGCEKDPCAILDVYVHSALQQIYQTDNIVRLRDLHECLLENGDYDDMGRLRKDGLLNFSGFLNEYAKVVAGKKVGHIVGEGVWPTCFF